MVVPMNHVAHHLAAVILLLVAAPALAKDPLPAPEQKALERIAASWVKLGVYAAKKRLSDQAGECLERAREAAPESKRVKAFAKASRTIRGEPKKSALKGYERKAKKTRAEVAKAYESLGRSAPAPRSLRYLGRALQAQPTSERWSLVSQALPAAWSAGDTKGASETARTLSGLSPPKELEPLLERYVRLAAVGAVVLRQAKSHAMRYYLSLPKNYDPASKQPWPVLVAVDGAGSGFQGCAKGFAKARGDLPCLVVAPCGFANTNAIKGKQKEKYLEWYDEEAIALAEKDRFEFDRAGLVAILDELREEFGAAPKVCITGFSGGGNLTYQMIFRHPERLQAAAPACANFTRPSYANLKVPADHLGLPIHILTGAKDPHRQWTHGKEGVPGIEMQTDAAVKALDALGFTKVERTLVPGLGHSPARKRVVEFFRTHLER
jgi:poly(3-hydroxybutyrate) depolymerase